LDDHRLEWGSGSISRGPPEVRPFFAHPRRDNRINGHPHPALDGDELLDLLKLEVEVLGTLLTLA